MIENIMNNCVPVNFKTSENVHICTYNIMFEKRGNAFMLVMSFIFLVIRQR